MMLFLLLVSTIVPSCIADFSVDVPPVVFKGSCPSSDAVRSSLSDEVRAVLQDKVIPAIRCTCAGRGEWTRIAHLNMSNPDQQCPSNWALQTDSVRGCGRTSDGRACDSAFFPSNGTTYSHICGKVNAFQRGITTSFEGGLNDNPSLDGPYIDGISLTHGATGSRQHIWSFASSLFETDPNYSQGLNLRWNCPCTNTNFNWPYQTPQFLGNDYFCDTGNPGPGFNGNLVYSNDPLWDGVGCGPTNACCQFNNPPWFCVALPEPTSDDLEMRLCFIRGSGEADVLVNLVDIYVM